MSITLYEKRCGNLSGEVRQNKYENTFEACIYYYGKTVYKNHFSTFENAKRAVNRNMKKYI